MKKRQNGIQYIDQHDKKFVNDAKLIDEVMFRLIQRVENIIHISKEFKEKFSIIKWEQIIGFRNGIVYDYGKR